jgi:hypothetical protein
MARNVILVTEVTCLLFYFVMKCTDIHALEAVCSLLTVWLHFALCAFVYFSGPKQNFPALPRGHCISYCRNQFPQCSTADREVYRVRATCHMESDAPFALDSLKHLGVNSAALGGFLYAPHVKSHAYPWPKRMLGHEATSEGHRSSRFRWKYGSRQIFRA